MNEVYTCICGGQAFCIHDGFIRCEKCSKKYDIKYVESSIDVERVEDPSEFNERIRKEAKNARDNQ